MTIGHEVEGSSPSVPSKAYVSIGLEMINRPMHYLFRKVVYLMKRDHQLSAKLTFLTNVSLDTKK